MKDTTVLNSFILGLNTFMTGLHDSAIENLTVRYLKLNFHVYLI